VARSPIFRPYSVPSSIALRKWNPMRTREYAFSVAAWEKLVNERSTGDGSLQVLPAGRVTPQS
jgi:hypothetical protein